MNPESGRSIARIARWKNPGGSSEGGLPPGRCDSTVNRRGACHGAGTVRRRVAVLVDLDVAAVEVAATRLVGSARLRRIAVVGEVGLGPVRRIDQDAEAIVPSRLAVVADLDVIPD